MVKKVAKNPVANLLRKLPDTPGVYQFCDSRQDIIYIGKAKSLKNRVKSYFLKSQDLSLKHERLVKEIADLKWLETSTEVEALALEANLVHEHQPKFNVLLRDDKHFLYLKITTQEDFPRLLTVRRVERDGAKYFGPKTDARATRDAVKLVQKLFKIRTCNLGLIERNNKIEVTKKPIKYPCLYAHLGQCGAPCDQQITQADYAELVVSAVAFLGGDTRPILKTLQTKMQTAAAAKNFELAAQLRDKVQSLTNLNEKQVVSDPDLASRDVIGLVVDPTRAYLAVLEVREGKLINQQNFELKTAESTFVEVLAAFVQQYYALATDLPWEVLLPAELADTENLEKWLTARQATFPNATQRKIKILAPQKGKKESLLRLAEKNAAAFRVQNKAKFENASERTIGACEELAKALNIERKLKRIEAYDISHLGGTATVGSMVVLEHGEPKNMDYRQFKIRTLAKGKVDDYASLSEVLGRRMSYLTEQLPAGVRIRRATKKDLIWIREELNKQIRSDEGFQESTWYVVSNGKQPIGFVRERNWKKEGFCEMGSLWVSPDERQQGLGRSLVRHMLKRTSSKKIYLDCTENEIGFYEQFGFMRMHTSKKELLSKINRWLKKHPELKQPSDSIQITTMVWERKSQQADSSFATKPDLVILDGGKGQLSSVLKTVKFPKTTMVVGLAKREEEIWKQVRNKKEKVKSLKFERVLLPRDSNALYLIQRVRDEAHRTANDLRKKILSSIDQASELDELAGVGEATRRQLLKKFGSVAGIKAAPKAKLVKVAGVKKGEQIYEALR